MPITPEPNKTSVMLLAAGRGQRMMPLTANTPKPMLKLNGKPLIEHHLCALSEQGFEHVVINIAYCGEQIIEHIQSGDKWGLEVEFSDESASGALETAGGIANALTLIKSDPFLVINADIFTDYAYRLLLTPLNTKARLVLVPNPSHNPKGDFSLAGDDLLELAQDHTATFTYSGIGLYSKQLFNSLGSEKQALAPILKNHIASNDISGQIHRGEWRDIGTPERLHELNRLSARVNLKGAQSI